MLSLRSRPSIVVAAHRAWWLAQELEKKYFADMENPQMQLNLACYLIRHPARDKKLRGLYMLYRTSRETRETVARGIVGRSFMRVDRQGSSTTAASTSAC